MKQIVQAGEYERYVRVQLVELNELFYLSGWKYDFKSAELEINFVKRIVRGFKTLSYKVA